MSKFNIGDKVKLRDDLTIKELRARPYFPIELLEYLIDYIETHTIKRFSKKENFVVIEVDEEELYFYPEWLELVEPAVVHDFEVGDYVKMVGHPEEYIEAIVGKTYKIVGCGAKRYSIIGDMGNSQLFNKHDYALGKFVKVEKTELTLDEIADKFNIPVAQLKIKK